MSTHYLTSLPLRDPLMNDESKAQGGPGRSHGQKVAEPRSEPGFVPEFMLPALRYSRGQRRVPTAALTKSSSVPGFPTLPLAVHLPPSPHPIPCKTALSPLQPASYGPWHTLHDEKAASNPECPPARPRITLLRWGVLL